LKRGEIPSIGGLTSFVAAAQHGSFTRAADELHLSQGAISRQIREIESHLGVRLFERIRQRIILTDAGKLYLTQVKTALDELADATRKVSSFSNGAILNLVALPTFATRWLVPRLPKFHNKHPTIAVNVTTRQSPSDHAREPFDAAVFHSAPHWPGTISHFLMHADMVAVASPKLNARRVIKAPGDVAKFTLLHNMGNRSCWAGWFDEAGVKLERPPHSHAYQDYEMVAQAAVAGLGIALLPRYLVEGDLAARRLEIVASDFADIKTSYYLVLPESRAGSSAVQAFAEWLIAETRVFKAGDESLAHGKHAARRPNGRHKGSRISL
jgi:LysR family transcriptional regulator, glycine cleavage system transcriptional activator